MLVVADQWQFCGGKLAMARASASSTFGAAERRELRMRRERERERVLIGHQEIMCVCFCKPS